MLLFHAIQSVPKGRLYGCFDHFCGGQYSKKGNVMMYQSPYELVVSSPGINPARKKVSNEAAWLSQPLTEGSCYNCRMKHEWILIFAFSIRIYSHFELQPSAQITSLQDDEPPLLSNRNICIESAGFAGSYTAMYQFYQFSSPSIRENASVVMLMSHCASDHMPCKNN